MSQDYCKVFVGSLSWDTDNEALQNQFSQYGVVTEAIVIRDHETGRSRGFGFVTYTNDEDAQKAVEQMDGQEFDGRNVKVEICGSSSSGRRHGGSGQRGGSRQ